MNSLRTLARFLGWCTVINFSLLLFGGLAWILVKDGAAELTGTLFGVTELEVKATFLRVLLQYRAAIIFFNLVPYVSLKVMA